MSAGNLDKATIESFGAQWAAYDQSAASMAEQDFLFSRYFSIFPWDALPENAVGFDMGCGSGRWAKIVAQRAEVARLICVEPAEKALYVARRNLAGQGKCEFVQGTTGDCGIAPASMDFGYALGVLHHIPDTGAALRDCVRYLKPGAPFLVYLYYALENKPTWYRALWRMSEGVRFVVARAPAPVKHAACEMIAACVYWPLSRLAGLLKAAHFPLYDYRNTSYYRMRHNARDRFGTRLERRFTRAEIAAMMEEAGLCDIVFREDAPYWCAVGYKLVK